MKLITTPALSFDDVLLEPGYSTLNSREEVEMESKFLGLNLSLPIISSNMNYVTGPEMADAMWDAGGVGIIHRFASKIDQENWFRYLETQPFISVGARNPEETLEWIKHLMATIYGPYAVCIDVAHGHLAKVISLIASIKSDFPLLKVIAGNVATPEAYFDLSEAGADAIKVGIGPGAACTTRVVTGIGVPQLQAIMDCAEQKNHQKQPTILIADGGIRNSGDIVKALAAGADFVMLGHLLAGSQECPGELISAPDGKTYKRYMGQSIFGVNGTKYTKEGVTGFEEAKGPVKDTLHQLRGGIRSGMSYVGARNLQELRDKAVFRVVTQASIQESNPRIRQIL